MQYLTVAVQNQTGLITLNRPQALNALNLAMIHGLHQQLKTWENDANIKQVVITSSSDRAFCAGGDIRALYDAYKRGEKNLSVYFNEEYKLNRYIKHYAKPYIAILNGITMGGGLGISIHGSLRLALNNLVLAMPESSIGYFTDIGATYFLSRIPDEIGTYMALTSARLNATESLYAGLIDQIIGTPPEENHLEKYRDIIKNCFKFNSIEEILDALLHAKNNWAKEIHDVILTKSPTSLKNILSALRKAKTMDFDQCMDMEYELACYFMTQHDFFEGVRAAIVDKDQRPQWQPAVLSHVQEFPK